MQRSIQFYEYGLTGKTVLEYSDERLIEVVSEIINKVGGTHIYLSFFDRTDRYGGMTNDRKTSAHGLEQLGLLRRCRHRGHRPPEC